jgi:hypothetical protein
MPQRTIRFNVTQFLGTDLLACHRACFAPRQQDPPDSTADGEGLSALIGAES